LKVRRFFCIEKRNNNRSITNLSDDIAWQGKADHANMVAAIDYAFRLATGTGQAQQLVKYGSFTNVNRISVNLGSTYSRSLQKTGSALTM
jgi:hypothetical protein